MDAADAMREAARRFRAGETLEGLFAPDCVIHGNPGGWLAAPQGSGFADQLAASDDQQSGYELREILSDRGRHALFTAVWTRGGEARGLAGLFFGIATTEDGRIVRMDLFAEEPAARAALESAVSDRPSR